MRNFRFGDWVDELGKFWISFATLSSSIEVDIKLIMLPTAQVVITQFMR